MGNSKKQEEILTDKKRNGKERPWKKRKGQSVNVSRTLDWADTYEYAKEGYMSFEEAREMQSVYRKYMGWLWKKSEKMYECGDRLEFTVGEDGSKKLYRAWFCKDRLCPMCNWRRGVKLTGQLLKILQTMKERKISGEPIFVTFTMKNVKGDDISKSFSDFAEGFHRLMKYKKVKDMCIGAIRASEITYNRKCNNYNTHIHCLLWMKPEYFNGDNYISQEKWTEFWRRSAKLDYKPLVYVERVKPNPTETDPTGYIKAVLEIAKYTAKPTAIPNLNGDIWMTDEDKMKAGERISMLERGMYKKRLISFFGIFKKLHKELDLDDVEDGDLVGADEEATGESVETVCYAYDYIRHDYYLMERSEQPKKIDDATLKAYFDTQEKKHKENAKRFDEYCAERKGGMNHVE